MRLYLNNGQLGPAITELHDVLQQEKKDRQMLNFRDIYECYVPSIAFEIFGHRASINSDTFTSGDAKYMASMVT